MSSKLTTEGEQNHQISFWTFFKLGRTHREIPSYQFRVYSFKKKKKYKTELVIVMQL